MSDDITAIILTITVILGPIWIFFHYATKWRAGRRLNAQDEAVFQQLDLTARRMEQRLTALERILDAEVPDWRHKSNLGAE